MAPTPTAKDLRHMDAVQDVRGIAHWLSIHQNYDSFTDEELEAVLLPAIKTAVKQLSKRNLWYGVNSDYY